MRTQNCNRRSCNCARCRNASSCSRCQRQMRQESGMQCSQCNQRSMTNMDVDSYMRPWTDLPYAASFVRMQSYQNLYDPAEALHRGTYFGDLDQPMTDC